MPIAYPATRVRRLLVESPEEKIQGQEVQQVCKEGHNHCSDQTGWMTGCCQRGQDKFFRILLSPVISQERRASQNADNPLAIRWKKSNIWRSRAGFQTPDNKMMPRLVVINSRMTAARTS